MREKPKLALYWAASCGGCEITVIDLGVRILKVAEAFDIVFWPVAMDFKYEDVEAMADKSIDLCLFNGAIRTSENEHLARMLRAKSKTLVAFGSCAHEGCIPALANLTTRGGILDYVYREAPSVDPACAGTYPMPETEVAEGMLEIPVFWEEVMALDQVVPVEYYIPGCPPQTERVWDVIQLITSGATLPPPGSVIGAGTKTCCDECLRERKEKKIRAFHRPHEIQTKADECLLDQGLVCMGPATRSGCGALCTAANVPCRGCYGPPPGCADQGAKMMSALSSVIDSTDPDEIDRILDQVPDLAGTLYRFSLGHSMLRRKAVIHA